MFGVRFHLRILIISSLILFDIDNTLIFGKGVGREASERAMLELFGSSGTLATHQFRGKTDWGTLIELLTPLGLVRDQIDAVMPTYNTTLGKHFASIVHRFPVEPCPGGHELVAALSARPDVLLGIVTGNVETVAPLKLAAGGYDPNVFRVGAYGNEAHDRTLLPPIALQRAIAYQGTSFERVVIIGDTPDDIECARSIQARCIGVATGSFSRAELEAHQPAVVLDSLADLDATLTAIFN